MKKLRRALSLVPTACEVYISYCKPRSLLDLPLERRGKWAVHCVYNDGIVLTCEVVRETASREVVGTIRETHLTGLQNAEHVGPGRASRDKVRSTARKLNMQAWKEQSDGKGDPCLDWFKELLAKLDIQVTDSFLLRVKTKA
ncbi:uncharacterized protein LOC135390169 [Ornithodoros turicata]|uniref:uncharacterized protein LOC135390169 n=1 Tax=Ornithodoros turicata TaxID=34597 RepID=UPI0031389FE2